MIDHERKLLFLHIARTGGTSIEYALTGQDWWRIEAATKHISAGQARKHYGEEIWGTYFKFSVVRNPWDRVVSMWAAGSWHQASNLDQNCSFETFIKKLRPHSNEAYNSLLCCDALNDKIDFVMRFEHLQEEFNSMLSRIGAQHITLPRKECRPHKPYSEMYGDVEKQLVREIFHKDITAFGYEF